MKLILVNTRYFVKISIYPYLKQRLLKFLKRHLLIINLISLSNFINLLQDLEKKLLKTSSKKAIRGLVKLTKILKTLSNKCQAKIQEVISRKKSLLSNQSTENNSQKLLKMLIFQSKCKQIYRILHNNFSINLKLMQMYQTPILNHKQTHRKIRFHSALHIISLILILEIRLKLQTKQLIKLFRMLWIYSSNL